MSDCNLNSITINGVEYFKKEENKSGAVIVRTYSAGVFYGYIESRNGKEVVMTNVRRMWQWYGASLSECAQSGTPDPSKCKFPEAVDRVTLTEVIEILDLTEKAKKTLDSVKVWKA